LQPDLVTLDIEMPEMDGIETLRQIRKLYPRLRVVMFSTLTQRGAGATLEALSLGADDYVAKAANGGSLDRSLQALRTELIPKVKQFFSLPVPPAPGPPKRTGSHAKPGAGRVAKISAVGIGVSTGGPQALAQLIPRLPGNLPVPVLVVQHMPPTFTRFLAERLHACSSVCVQEAESGMEVKAGSVIIARGDHHLRVLRRGSGFVTELTQDPPENFCRPAVDVLFRSMAATYGGETLSVVLTGMGEDGLRGTKVLKAAGGYSLAQDQATSVVWGMPGAVVQAGLADQVLPLSLVAPTIIALATA
jgi:two-component system chemotaxis response regulator CheB